MRKMSKGKAPWNKDKKLPELSKDHKNKISRATKGKNNPRFINVNKVNKIIELYKNHSIILFLK